jgi:uncharacterized protein
MIFYHVAMTAADDYLTRRVSYREAHLARGLQLRAQGMLIAGGPAPDGKTADLFYRAPDAELLKRLVEEDPYFTGRVWTAYQPRAFSHFLEPWEPPPLVTDGSRRATLVEGMALDVDMATFALIEARGAHRLAFGGFFEAGETLAALVGEAADATKWLEETGFWKPGSLVARNWLYVL